MPIELPHELWYEIISQAIVNNVHDLVTAKCHYPRRRTTGNSTMNSIVTIPNVCKGFRSISRRTILYTICGGVDIGCSHDEPIPLRRLFAIFDYLRDMSPTNYDPNRVGRGERDGHRQRQGFEEEVIFAPHAVVISNVGLARLKALRQGMYQPSLWLSLLDRLADLLQSERAANTNRNTKPSATSALRKYQIDYREIHCSVLAYLSLLPSRTIKRDESQRMNSFLLFLRQLERSSKTFDKMQQLTPDLLYNLFNTTGLGSVLEDCSKITVLKTQANRLSQRWMPLVLRYNQSHPTR